MFGDRDQIRRFYCRAWRKHREGRPLEPMEALVRDVIAEHPEYHDLLEAPDRALAAEYTPEQGRTNPFLHMGLHVALREQAESDRPPGVAALQRRLLAWVGDRHAAEHRMLDCLGEALWRAQRDNAPPDEAAYIDCLRRLLD